MSAIERDPPERPAPPAGTAEPVSGTAARRARQQARRAASAAGPSRAPAPPTGTSSPSAAPTASPSATDADTATAAATVGPAGSSRRGGELDPDALAALEEERTFLLRSLDDLEREHDAGDVDDVDYEALKDDYTARAAAVIRSIEQRQAAFRQTRPPRRRSRTVAWLAALLVVSVGLGIFVAQSSGRREAGDSISGDIRTSSRDQLLDARAAQGEGRFTDAIRLYDEVLASQPANTEALTYKGWLLFLTSRQTQDRADTQVLEARAKELLDQALTVDPAYGDALVFRARVLHELGFDEAALADLDAVQPGSVPEFMTPVIEELRNEVAGASAPPGTAPAGS